MIKYYEKSNIISLQVSSTRANEYRLPRLRWKSSQTFSPFLVTKLKLKVGSSRDWELEFTRDEGVFYFRFALAQPPRRNDSNRETIKAFSRTKKFPLHI